MNFKRDPFKYLPPYRCIVPGCITNREGSDNYTTLFHFPQHSFLLEKWKTNMPFLNFHEIDLSISLICELHFEAHQIIQTSSNSRKMLVMNALPTLFGTNYPHLDYHHPIPIPTHHHQYHHHTPSPATTPVMHQQNPSTHHLVQQQALEEESLHQQQAQQIQEPPPLIVQQQQNALAPTVSCRFCLKPISSDEMIEIDREIRSQFEDITHTELKMSAFFSSVSCTSCCRDLRKCSSIKYKLVKNQAKLYEMINPKDSNDNASSDGNAFTDFQMEMDGKVEVKIEVSDDLVKIKDEPGTTIATAWQHDPLEECSYDKLKGDRFSANGE